MCGSCFIRILWTGAERGWKNNAGNPCLDEMHIMVYNMVVYKDGTPEDLLNAIKTVAHAKGMTKTAKEAGITRDGLYKALSPDGNPAFSTVWNILRSLGYTLTPTPIAHNPM